MQEENFLKNTRQIKKSLGLSTEEYLTIFGMTKKEAESTLLNPRNFPLAKAMEFCEYFELDIVSMFSDQFDVNSFARNYGEKTLTLPERYSLDQNSRAITLINFMTCLEDCNYGWLNELIFRRLQIPKHIIHFPELQISIKLVTDFLELTEQFKVNLDVMKIAGQRGIVNLDKTFHFTQNLPTATDKKNHHLFYENFFQNEIKKFDKSFNYKIESFKQDVLIIKCKSNGDLKDCYKKSSLSNTAFVQYKAGIGSGLSTLFDLQVANTQILATEEDSGYDLIAIDFSRPPSCAGLSLY